MTSRRQSRWLDARLSEWLEAGLVSADAARAIRSRTLEGGRRGGAVPLFAVLGAALVGLGVILLLAHNWEALSRAARTTLCFALLGGGQALALFVTLRREGSLAWQEASALALALAFAAALALIGQTYQIPGDLEGFLATWWWLSLPLVYALRSRAVACLVAAQAMGLYLASFVDERPDPWHWARLLALLPFVAQLRGGGIRDGLFVVVLLLAVSSSALLGALSLGGAALLVGTGLLSAGLYALGHLERLGATPGGEALAAPSRALGLAGAVTLVLCMSVSPLWEVVAASGSDELLLASVLPSASVILAAAGVSVARGIAGGARERAAELVVVALPLVVGAGVALQMSLADHTGDKAATLVMSAYGLALGASEVLRGVRSGERGHANLGMVLLVGVIWLRFASWEWSFTARGIAFIAAGAAFLLLNLVLRRQARTATSGVEAP